MDTRVGCYGWIEQHGRVLLTHWRGDPGRLSPGWTLPGGGMDPGESTEQTTVREVAEETGFAVELEELLGTDSVHIPVAERLSAGSLPLHSLRIVYRARIVGGTLTVEADGSTDDARWFTPGELAAAECVDLVHAARRMAGWDPGRR